MSQADGNGYSSFESRHNWLASSRRPRAKAQVGVAALTQAVNPHLVSPLKVIARSGVADWSREKDEVVMSRHRKPASVLIGFKSEGDWFDFRLEYDQRFLRRGDLTTASKLARVFRLTPVTG